MTTNHTAPEMLEAVGFDWHKDYALVQCPQCKNHRYYCVTGNTWHRFDCSRPDTSHIAPTYTGPALGTPELDALLLVAGQNFLVDHGLLALGMDTASSQKLVKVQDALKGILTEHFGVEPNQPFTTLMCFTRLPGHALARAIREVGGS